MEFKGTKGIWEVTKETPNGLEYLKGHIEVASGEYAISCIFTDFGTKEETKANAKLIAAAPEMLQMLIKMKNNDDWDISDHIELKTLISKILS